MASTLRLPEPLDAQLTKAADKKGVSRNQLIIEILSESFERDAAMQEATRIFDKISGRDAALLERLADA
jgi:hypothetical protein